MRDDGLKLPKWARVEEAPAGAAYGKRCWECGRWLTNGVGGTWGSFHRKATTPDGLKDECRECMAIYQKTHKDVMKRAALKYEASRPERGTRGANIGHRGGARKRLEAFAASGEHEGSEVEKSAQRRLEAFTLGGSVYEWQKESD